MSTHGHTASKPSRKQLAFLRALAHRTGTTFVYPQTRRQASRQIAALLDRPASPPLERQLDLTPEGIERELHAIRITDAEILEERRRESQDASEAERGERALREQDALIAAGVHPDDVVRVWENW